MKHLGFPLEGNPKGLTFEMLWWKGGDGSMELFFAREEGLHFLPSDIRFVYTCFSLPPTSVYSIFPLKVIVQSSFS